MTYNPNISRSLAWEEKYPKVFRDKNFSKSWDTAYDVAAALLLMIDCMEENGQDQENSYQAQMLCDKRTGKNSLKD